MVFLDVCIAEQLFIQRQVKVRAVRVSSEPADECSPIGSHSLLQFLPFELRIFIRRIDCFAGPELEEFFFKV